MRANRSPSRSTTQFRTAPSVSYKFRTIFGPQYPTPATPTLTHCATVRDLLLSIRKQHDGNGPPENPEIQPDRPSTDVLKIEVDHLIERRVIAPAHLPEAGDAGPGTKTLEITRPIVVHLIRQRRARTDQAHVAAQ